MWKVDLDRSILKLALQVETTGWIGFGIGEPTSGSMPGADMALISFDTGTAVLKDAYATQFAQPTEDTCQDWRLKGYEQNADVTVVELERNFDTGDTQDHPILPGSNRVVFAYGLANQPSVTYHQSRRGMNEISFWVVPGSELTLPPDSQEKTFEINLGGYQVPAQKTTYVCSAHIIPLPQNASDQHIIQVDPIIDENNVEFAHHMIVHICDNNTANSYVNTYFNNPGECNSPVGDTTRGCRSLLYTWGELSFFLPFFLFFLLSDFFCFSFPFLLFLLLLFPSSFLLFFFFPLLLSCRRE